MIIKTKKYHEMKVEVTQMTYEQLPAMLTVSETCTIVRFKYNATAKLIRELNAELEQKGYKTLKGRVSKQYLFERMGIEKESFNINEI